MQAPTQSLNGRGLRARAPSDGQRIVGVDAAANMLGISPGYLYRMLRAGELPVVRIGGRTLIAVAEIDKFIAARSGAFLDNPSAAPKAHRTTRADPLAIRGGR